MFPRHRQAFPQLLQGVVLTSFFTPHAPQRPGQPFLFGCAAPPRGRTSPTPPKMPWMGHILSTNPPRKAEARGSGASLCQRPIHAVPTPSPSGGGGASRNRVVAAGAARDARLHRDDRRASETTLLATGAIGGTGWLGRRKGRLWRRVRGGRAGIDLIASPGDLPMSPPSRRREFASEGAKDRPERISALPPGTPCCAWQSPGVPWSRSTKPRFRGTFREIARRGVNPLCHPPTTSREVILSAPRCATNPWSNGGTTKQILWRLSKGSENGEAPGSGKKARKTSHSSLGAGQVPRRRGATQRTGQAPSPALTSTQGRLGSQGKVWGPKPAPKPGRGRQQEGFGTKASPGSGERRGSEGGTAGAATSGTGRPLLTRGSPRERGSGTETRERHGWRRPSRKRGRHQGIGPDGDTTALDR